MYTACGPFRPSLCFQALLGGCLHGCLHRQRMVDGSGSTASEADGLRFPFSCKVLWLQSAPSSVLRLRN